MSSPSIDVLSSILSDHGCISESQIPALVASYPHLNVGVKMGCSLRFMSSVKHVSEEIAHRIKVNPEDYVREVFICSGTYDALRVALGFPKEY